MYLVYFLCNVVIWSVELFMAVVVRLLYYGAHFLLFLRLPKNRWVFVRRVGYELGDEAYEDTRVYATLWAWLSKSDAYVKTTEHTGAAYHVNNFDID